MQRPFCIPDAWRKAEDMPGARLCLKEQEWISRGLAERQSFGAIGRELGRPSSTVSREVGRNGGAERYRAVSAARAAQRRARRPKVRKLVTDRKLARLVAYKLSRKGSPEQIAAYLHQRYAEPQIVRTDCEAPSPNH